MKSDVGVGGSADFARMATFTSLVSSLVVTILALTNSAYGQNQTQCNVPGECIGMYKVEVDPSVLQIHFVDHCLRVER